VDQRPAFRQPGIAINPEQGAFPTSKYSRMRGIIPPNQPDRTVAQMASGFYRKAGALLGLFAILMATLAPTISQAVAQHRDVSVLTDWMCSAQAEPEHQGAGKSAPHALSDHWQACGYCSLLAHIPPAPAVRPTFATTVWAIQHRVATRFEHVRRVVAFTAAQPRAPPFSS
jgi:Protein of unknown function (DUF2946)